MYKIDLHTHSDASPDGGIKLKTYRRILESGVLNAVAITDHDRIDNALKIQAELGDVIIVGEEIMTKQGEIIGLFLDKRVSPGMSARKTAEAIKDQGGIVYVPHPFETIRSGLTAKDLDEIVDVIDVIEVYNGRAVFQNRSPLALAWARSKSKGIAASSDAHSTSSFGKTYSLIESKPTSTNLVSQLGQARFVVKRAGPRAILAPKTNRLIKKLKRPNAK